MNTKHILAVTLMLGRLTAAGAAAHGPVDADDTLETAGTVTGDEYRYYLDDGKVAYPATVRRVQNDDGEWVEKRGYENTSVERFAAMQGSDMARDELETYLEQELAVDNLRGISIGTTGDEDHHFAVQALYVQPGENSDSIAEPVVSYEELQNALPGEVEATVAFANRTDTVVFPVTHDMTITVEDLDDTENYPDGTTAEEKIGSGSASQGGGSSDGDTWQADFERVNASCRNGDDEETLRNVEYGGEDAVDGRRTISFQSTITAGTPCHDAGITHVEQDGNTYTINVTTERSGGVCVDCVGDITYDASFTANEPFRLRVLHDGEHVDTLDYPGYEDTGQDGTGENSGGLLQRFLDWLTGLF